MWEDFVYSLQFFINAEKISVVENYLYYYYHNIDSISGQVDPEKICKRFEQIKNNVETLERIATNYGLDEEYSQGFVAIKYKAKSEFLPIVGSFKYWKKWLKAFSDINLKVLFVKTINRRAKIKYVATLLGLYPLFAR